MKATLLSLYIFIIATATSANGQTSTSCKPFKKASTNETNFNFINHFSTNKCLRVANFGHFPNSNIFLDECSWKSPTRDQLFNVSSSKIISDGFLFTVEAGLEQRYCMTTTKDGTLQTSHCRESSFDYIWRVKPVTGQENQFLIQHVGSTGCLIPSSRATRSSILLAPCNSYKTEQIWKLCSNSNSTVAPTTAATTATSA